MNFSLLQQRNMKNVDENKLEFILQQSKHKIYADNYENSNFEQFLIDQIRYKKLSTFFTNILNSKESLFWVD